MGGWTTARRPGKIHAVVDGLGNPLRIILSVGQQADIKQAEALLTGFQTNAVLADRGYDADSLLTWLANSQVEAVMPAKRNRLIKRSIDKNLYKDRNKRGRPSGGALFQQAQPVPPGGYSLREDGQQLCWLRLHRVSFNSISLTVNTP